MCMHAKLLQLCPTLCNPVDCSPPGPSVHGILQERILEWDVISSFRGYSPPRYWTCVLLCPLNWQAGSLLVGPTGKTKAKKYSTVIHSLEKLKSMQYKSAIRNVIKFSKTIFQGWFRFTEKLGGKCRVFIEGLSQHMHQYSSAAQSCLTLCNPMNCSTPGLPVHHQLPKFTQTNVHWVCDVIQLSHPLSSPSPPAPNPSQHQDLFQWVNSSHEVAKVLDFQPQHQSFQWTPRTGLL